MILAIKRFCAIIIAEVKTFILDRENIHIYGGLAIMGCGLAVIYWPLSLVICGAALFYLALRRP